MKMSHCCEGEAFSNHHSTKLQNPNQNSHQNSIVKNSVVGEINSSQTDTQSSAESDSESSYSVEKTNTCDDDTGLMHIDTNLEQLKSLLSHFTRNPLQIASMPQESHEVISLMESLKMTLLMDQNQQDVASFPTETFSRLICEEIFIHILSFLDPYEIITSVRFVSKEFFELSEKTRSVNSQQAYCVSDLNLKDFEYIIERLGPATQILYLESDLLVYFANVTNMRPLENVTQLIFPAWSSCWTKRFFERLPHLFPNLTCLFMNAEITYGQFEDLEPLDLRSLCERMPSLVQVEICKTCNLTPVQIGRLEKLTIYNYEDTTEDFEKILSSGTNLVEIYITNFPLDFVLSPALSVNCPRLSKLHVDESQVAPILNALDPKQLTQLVIFADRVWIPTYACVKAICNLERLSRLEVSSWEPIQDSAHRFKSRQALKTLDILYVHNKRTLNLGSLSHFPNLRHLQIPHFSKNFSIEKFKYLENFEIKGRYAEMFLASASLQKMRIEHVKKLIVDCPRLIDIMEGTYDSIVVLHSRLPVLSGSNVDMRNNIGLRALKLKAFRPVYKLGGNFSTLISLEMSYSLLTKFAQSWPEQASKIRTLSITPSTAQGMDRKTKDLHTIMRYFPNISRLGMLHAGFQRVSYSSSDVGTAPSYPGVLKFYFSDIRSLFSVEYPLLCFPKLMYISGTFTPINREFNPSLDEVVTTWKKRDFKFSSVRQCSFESVVHPFTQIAQFFPNAHSLEYSTLRGLLPPTTRFVVPVQESITSLSIDATEYHMLDRFPNLTTLRLYLNQFHGDVRKPIHFPKLKQLQITTPLYTSGALTFDEMKQLVNLTTTPSLRLFRILFLDEFDFQLVIDQIEMFVNQMRSDMPETDILLCPGNLSDEGF